MLLLQYHADPLGQRVSLSLTGTDYCTLTARAKESPFFVLPLSKGQPGAGGFLTLVLQMQLPNVLVTSLQEYQQ